MLKQRQDEESAKRCHDAALKEFGERASYARTSYAGDNDGLGVSCPIGDGRFGYASKTNDEVGNTVRALLRRKLVLEDEAREAGHKRRDHFAGEDGGHDVVLALGEHANATNAPHVKAQCLPGTVDSESGGLLGAQTLAMISDMHFDLAFLGARSASLDVDAVTTFEMDDGLVKHMALQNSDVTYVLTETGKYEASGVYVYARLSEFDGAICDDKLSAETRERIEALGLKVI